MAGLHNSEGLFRGFRLDHKGSFGARVRSLDVMLRLGNVLSPHNEGCTEMCVPVHCNSNITSAELPHTGEKSVEDLQNQAINRLLLQMN